MRTIHIGPQPGPQTLFLETPATVAIFGGAAGGGKSHGLLLDPLRHINNSLFRSVKFRRTTKQITNPGALWDSATNLYAPLLVTPSLAEHSYTFKSGMKVQFAHLEHEKNIYDWQGAQVSQISMDELTHFTEKMFFYMLSRLRSEAGTPGYMRATTNPDADSWVARFISWWIDQDTGFAIPERSGVLRWFVRDGDNIVWSDHPLELSNAFPGSIPTSVTFIPSKIQDNPILMKRDPQYLANLMALPLVERARLLDGNWKIRASAGTVFKREWFPILETPPLAGRTVRYWDRAATERTDHNDPACTVGLKMRATHDAFVVLDVVRGQWSPGGVEQVIKNTAAQDGTNTVVWIEQDPGQAGVVEAKMWVKLLPGYEVRCNPARKDKVTRAGPVSAQAEAGNVPLVRGPWNEEFLLELNNFPDGKKKDQVDALSGAFAVLSTGMAGDFSKEFIPKPSTVRLGSGTSW